MLKEGFVAWLVVYLFYKGDFSMNQIRNILKTSSVVQLVFDIFYPPYIENNGIQIPLSLQETEEEFVKMLNNEFRVFFSSKSSTRQHIFKVRAVN